MREKLFADVDREKYASVDARMIEPASYRELDELSPQSDVTRLSAGRARDTLRAMADYIRVLVRHEPGILRRFVAALLFMLASKCIHVFVPFIFKQGIDMLSGGPPMQPTNLWPRARVANSHSLGATAVLLFAAYGALRTLANVLHELRNAVFVRAGQAIGRQVSRATFQHLHSLDAGWLMSAKVGSVTAIVNRGTRSVMMLFRALVLSFLPSLLELVLVCVIMAKRLSWQLSLATLAFFAAFVAFTLKVNQRFIPLRRAMNTLDNETNAKATDSLVNYDSIKYFNTAEFETVRYDRVLAEYEKLAVRNERLFALLNGGQSAIFNAGHAVVLCVGASRVARHLMTVGDLVMASSLLQQLNMPLQFLGWQMRELKAALVDLENLFTLLQRQPTVRDAEDAGELRLAGGGEIVFDRVSFSYEIGGGEDAGAGPAQLAWERSGDASGDGRPAHAQHPDQHRDGERRRQHSPRSRRNVLRDVSFRVPAGKTVAVVGRSGAGKSSLLRLLYRLWDVSDGDIRIDGQPIRGVTQASLRAAIGLIPQEGVLFNDSVFYNIAYGRVDATEAQVVAAAKLAHIHDAIMKMPAQYDTLVGERGVRLSGGEKQRVAMARAVLRSPPILVLDEATSALDTKTEQDILGALEELRRNRTVMVVAHRLSTVVNADEIIVLDAGRVAERGTHADLVSRPDGVYRGMWLRQTEAAAGDIDREAANGTRGAHRREYGEMGERNDGSGDARARQMPPPPPPDEEKEDFVADRLDER